MELPSEKVNQPIGVQYWKNQPLWKQTLYVLGLPRSGKSTIFNVLASCEHVEGLEEPLDLVGIAQKIAGYKDKPLVTRDFKDLYLSLMDNHYSELILGRSYNLRKQDKSYILNIKSVQHLTLAQARNRRVDVLEHLEGSNSVFLIVFNDMENSLDFITSKVPYPQLIHVRRDWRDVGLEIMDKGWLSDEQLRNQTNLLPGYQAKIMFENSEFYIPFVIPVEVKNMYLSLSDLDRACLYALIQSNSLENEIANVGITSHQIDFENLVKNPSEQIGSLMDALGLQESEMYRKNIAKLVADVKEIKIGKGRNYRPSGAFVEILKELNLELPA